MATVTKGRTFVSGETVTPTKLNELVDLATVTAIQTADISDAQITTAKLATVTAQALLPAGAVMPFAMNSAPNGWLAANGEAVSRSTYTALFSAIGTTHGAGDGSTTFNLPDLRGIFVRGSGSQTISGTTYSGTFALKEKDGIRDHEHRWSFFGFGAQPGTTTVPSANGDGTGAYDISMRPTTASTETRPANIALLYCIKF